MPLVPPGSVWSVTRRSALSADSCDIVAQLLHQLGQRLSTRFCDLVLIFGPPAGTDDFRGALCLFLRQFGSSSGIPQKASHETERVAVGAVGVVSPDDGPVEQCPFVVVVAIDVTAAPFTMSRRSVPYRMADSRSCAHWFPLTEARWRKDEPLMRPSRCNPLAQAWRVSRSASVHSNLW